MYVIITKMQTKQTNKKIDDIPRISMFKKKNTSNSIKTFIITK